MSYRRSVELEMDLAIDDGKQLTEEMKSIRERYLRHKEVNLREWEYRKSGDLGEIIEGLFYLLSPPSPAIIRYKIDR